MLTIFVLDRYLRFRVKILTKAVVKHFLVLQGMEWNGMACL